MTWLRVWALVTSGLLPCACGDDEAGAGTTGAPDTDTDTTPSPTTGSTQGPETSTGDSETTSDDDPTASESSSPDTTTEPPDTTTSGVTESGDTEEARDPTVFVSVDHGASPPALVTIVAQTANVATQCDLAPAASYDSIVFTRDNELLAHNVNNDRLERIDPCDCGFQAIGVTDLGTVELSVDAEDGLIGIDFGLSAFVEVNPATALGNVIGPLGVPAVDGALAWSDATMAAHAIDATADQLYVVDTRTGMVAEPLALAIDLTDPAMDVIGEAQTMYVCAGTTLYTLDTSTGAIVSVGQLAFAGTCTTLAAPRRAIDCLEP